MRFSHFSHWQIARLCLLLAVTALSEANVCYAAVSDKVLETKISTAKILPAGSKIVVSSSDTVVTVSTHVGDGSTNVEKDRKIEAVMIAKTIMDADASIKRVKTQFFSKNNPTEYSAVTVGISDIKAFGAGVISSEDLMKSLELVKGSDANSPLAAGGDIASSSGATASAADETDPSLVVVDGPLADARKKLLARIRKLKKSVNTTPYETYFEQIEQTAKGNSKSATQEMVDKLSQNIEAQEKALQRKNTPGASAVASSARSSSQTPLPPPPAASPDDVVPQAADSNSQDPFQSLLQGLASRAQLAKSLVPSPGIFYVERAALVRRWLMLGQANHALFRELENDARARDGAKLAAKLKTAYARYGVTKDDMQAVKDHLRMTGGRQGAWPPTPGRPR